MKHYNIAVIPGDGIGEEVTPHGVQNLDLVGEITDSFRMEYTYFPYGCNYYLEHGRMMEKDALKILSEFDAIYFGAVGFPSVPDHISLRGLRIPICQGFDQYVCLRPSELMPGIPSPLALRQNQKIDFVVVRENTEGEYVGAGGKAHAGLSGELAVETTVFTRDSVERVIRYAFDLAQRRNNFLTSATKSNAQIHVYRFWDEVFDEVSLEYPAVKTDRVLIDALAARCILEPESLDVVVASNLFGDILTDIGAAICGSLGIAPSANINPERIYPSMFEPVHGSAPLIVGKGIANPIAMIWSGGMMLDFLGEKEGAGIIYKAIKKLTTLGKVLTPDLGGSATTEEVANALMDICGKSD